MSLERRLAAVEAELARTRRRASRHRNLALLALAGLALGASVQRAVPLVLRAKSLELVDDAGRVVLRAAAGDDGGRLALFDRAGQELCALSSERAGAEIVLQNPAGRQVFRAASTALGGEAVWSDAAGREIATLHPNAQGASLLLTDRRGMAVTSLSSAPTGGALELRRSDGTRIVDIADREGRASLLLGGSQSTPAAVLESTVGTATFALAPVGLEKPGEDVPAAISFDVKPGQAMVVIGELERALVARSSEDSAEFALLDRGVQALRAASRLGDVGLWLQDGKGTPVFSVSSGELRAPAPPSERDRSSSAASSVNPLAPQGPAKEALDRRRTLASEVKPLPGGRLTPIDLLRTKAARQVFEEAAAEAAAVEGAAPAGKEPRARAAGTEGRSAKKRSDG